MGQTDLFYELIVDNFAGGGGASTGIELATGRQVDIAINHDPDAIAMHKANHPFTEHYCESVWDVDPYKATRGHKVALAWFSPDCKHFSKAKGGKPVSKNIRGLAWIVLKWAGTVKPRVIILENVEEFQTWGPVRKGKPVKSKKGETFQKWKEQLQSLGYKIEHRELVACDYGAPTTRKRFFLIARCDGMPIVWPEKTHGEGLIPYRTAADIIDWNTPCPSIFDTSAEIKDKFGVKAVRPLAENTMKRIARGIQKFVIDNPNPFIVQVNHSGEFRGQKAGEPLQTVTAKNGYGIVTPYMTAIGQTGFSDDRSYRVDLPVKTLVTKAEQCLVMPTIMCNNTNNVGASLETPLPTITTGNRNFLVSPAIIQYHSESGNGGVRGQGTDKPIMTIDAAPRYGLVAAFINRQFGASIGHSMNEPSATVTSVNKSNLVKAFLIKYYGQGVGQKVNEPMDTVVTKDRFGLVTVAGVDYQIIDIGMRMLEPKELYAAQGFPSDYIIDVDCNGAKYSKAKQVARCGNAVPPPFAEALVRANLPELCCEKLNSMEELRKKIVM